MPLVVPDPPATIAVATAVARRIALQQHLATQVESAFAVRAFRELPDREFGEEAPFLEGEVASAEIARLRWQLRSIGLLLLERAADVLEALIRHRSKELAPGSIQISLKPLPKYAVSRGKPPWRVVISAPSTLRLDEALEAYSMFFGVGVFLGSESRFRAFSRCIVGHGGLEGVVGGTFRSATDVHKVYLATCAHVIADGCGSLQHPRHAPPPGAPDAVLLRPTGCFSHPEDRAQPVFPADEAATARFQLAQVPLALHHPERRRSHGWLKYPVAAVLAPTGSLIRFPHYSVQPFRYRIGLLRWPPFRPHFAVPGDSGSWVIEQSTRIWLGMVVGGYDDQPDTLVADGQALLDYYSAIATGRLPRNGVPDLVPYSWS